MQYLCDWVHKIGISGLTAVNGYLTEHFDDDDECQEYAEWVIQDFQFFWWDNKPEVCFLFLYFISL